jgi:hypothetical protein
MPDEFPVVSRPVSPGTMVGYRLHKDNSFSTGKVRQAGYYVILVENEDGNEQLVFYDELVSVSEVTHMSIDASKLYVGCIILYKLLPAENPTNPDRL